MATTPPSAELFANINPFDNDDGTPKTDAQDIAAARAQGEISSEQTPMDMIASPPGTASDDNIGRLSPTRTPPRASTDLSNTATTTTHDIAHATLDKMKSTAHKFKLESMTTSGISRIFNPTAVRMLVQYRSNSDDDASAKELALLWRSRDSRKGRHSIAVPISRIPSRERRRWPAVVSPSKDVCKSLWKMLTTFPYWDMAFWSGWAYTVGSALFVIDGAFAWGPLRFPGSEFAGEAEYGVPLCFFFGALFYQIGAVMAYLEAINDGSFHGSAMRRLLEGHEEDQKRMLDDKIHRFFGHLVPHPHKHKEDEAAAERARAIDPEAGWKTREIHNLRPGSIYPADTGPAPRRGGVDLGGDEAHTSAYSTWQWWPTWHALRTHHIFEIGYLACTIQLVGVTLYGVTGVVVLPGLLSSLNAWQTNVAYWIPQMVAAACFLTASIMFTLEAQDEWWRPAPHVLGWWIGAWSVVGSVGFELSAAFGPASANSTGAAYQSSLSSMWGSAAYLTGSFLQWYEAMDKNPSKLELDGEWKGDRTFPTG